MIFFRENIHLTDKCAFYQSGLGLALYMALGDIAKQLPTITNFIARYVCESIDPRSTSNRRQFTIHFETSHSLDCCSEIKYDIEEGNELGNVFVNQNMRHLGKWL